MTFAKEIAVSVAPDKVWAFLWDVDRVARCLPGCKSVRTIVPHERYGAVVSERVGPFKIEVPLEIQVLETDPPRRLKAQASGRDAAMGTTLRVTLDLSVTGDGPGSRLAVNSEVTITGKLATLGHGIIGQKADGVITQFAEAMRAELEGEGRGGAAAV